MSAPAAAAPLVIPVDVADQAQVFAAADRVEDELGPIDVWVNVAFTSVFAPFEKIHPDEYRRVTEVSYLGYVYGTMAALQKMKPRDRGTIVQVGSALAYRGIPLQTAYCGAKHAIQGFHEALRCELLHEKSNVHVTMVQMPAVNTPQFSWVLSRLPHHAQPVPPIYQPEVAARGVLYAADHPQAAGVLGRRQHRRHPGRQRHRPGPAGPVPRQDRVLLPADQAETTPGRPGEPVGTGRRTRRQGLRHARHLRQPGQEHRAATVGLAPPRPARRRGQRGAGRPPRPWSAGPPAVTGMRAKALARGPHLGCRHGRGRCRGPAPSRPPWPGGQRTAAAHRTPAVVQGPGWAATAAGHRGADPARTALVIGAVAVDVLHATSMVAAAVIWPGYRRAALTSAAVAGCLRRCRCTDPARSAAGDRPARTGSRSGPVPAAGAAGLRPAGRRGTRRRARPARRHRLDVRAPVGQRRGLLRAARRPGRVLRSPRWTGSSGAATTKRAA